MNRRLQTFAIASLAAMTANIASPQVPADQLMAPPSTAEKFVVISTAGQHGVSSLWKSGDGTVLSRESILLRGMVWEQDESIHLGPNGQPDRIVIRGVTPPATPRRPSPFRTARRAGNRRSTRKARLTTEAATTSRRAAPSAQLQSSPKSSTPRLAESSLFFPAVKPGS
jgi:hypothetical protein